jgi:hypothetical protein
MEQKIAEWGMILLPRASGTVNAPPSMEVPGGAVTMALTWQVAQPIVSKIFSEAADLHQNYIGRIERR